MNNKDSALVAQFVNREKILLCGTLDCPNAATLRENPAPPAGWVLWPNGWWYCPPCAVDHASEPDPPDEPPGLGAVVEGRVFARGGDRVLIIRVSLEGKSDWYTLHRRVGWDDILDSVVKDPGWTP